MRTCLADILKPNDNGVNVPLGLCRKSSFFMITNTTNDPKYVATVFHKITARLIGNIFQPISHLLYFGYNYTLYQTPGGKL
jgi:hypothetical protein